MSLARVCVVALLCFHNVLCERKLCEFDDKECFTKGAISSFKNFVNDELQVTSSSDILHLDLIVGDLPTIKYKITNATLSGIKSCLPEHLSINPQDFDYHVVCKHLKAQGVYEISGALDSMPIEGKGDYIADRYDYAFLFHGEFEQEFDKDEKIHMLIKNYKLQIEARGKVEYDFKNLYDGDKEKSDAMHKYINENWENVEKSMRDPLMEKYMSLFIENINRFLKAVPVDEIFTYEA